MDLGSDEVRYECLTDACRQSLLFFGQIVDFFLC